MKLSTNLYEPIIKTIKIRTNVAVIKKALPSEKSWPKRCKHEPKIKGTKNTAAAIYRRKATPFLIVVVLSAFLFVYFSFASTKSSYSIVVSSLRAFSLASFLAIAASSLNLASSFAFCSSSSIFCFSSAIFCSKSSFSSSVFGLSTLGIE